jgi:hypothetical protein
LWQALYPDRAGEVPQDFEHQTVVEAEQVGVWSDRGVAVAYKQGAGEAGLSSAEAALRDFAAVASLVRAVDELAVETKQAEAQTEIPHTRSGRATRTHAEPTAAATRDLARRALELQAALSLPERNLLRQFCGAIQFEQVVARLGELSQSFAEQAHRAETEDAQKRGHEAARLRKNLRWLQVFVVGFITLEIVGLVLRRVKLDAGEQQTLALFGGPLLLGFAAMLLRPWKPSRNQGTGRMDWILVAAIVTWIVMWLAQLLRVW